MGLEFEPKDNNQVVQNIEVTVVTWSSPIAKNASWKQILSCFQTGFMSRRAAIFEEKVFKVFIFFKVIPQSF